MRFCILLLLCIGVLLHATNAQQQPGPPETVYLLKPAHVFDGESAQLHDGWAVLVRGQKIEAAGQYASPRYMELLMPNFYTQHILRKPPDQWPDPLNRAFKRLNEKVYAPMQGPSEMGASGKLEKWDRVTDLATITVPTLTIGAKHDTMDPAHMEKMAMLVKKGRYLYCPNGSHMAMYDDQEIYFDGLLKFIRDVDQGIFK